MRKYQFMTSMQALVHGDLHTGSIMLTPTDTRVIDPEFALVGPIGFDVGAVIGNLFLAYFAQEGHEAAPHARDALSPMDIAPVAQKESGTGSTTTVSSRSGASSRRRRWYVAGLPLRAKTATRSRRSARASCA